MTHLSFIKNMGRNIGKKSLSGKYSQKPTDHATDIYYRCI